MLLRDLVDVSRKVGATRARKVKIDLLAGALRAVATANGRFDPLERDLLDAAAQALRATIERERAELQAGAEQAAGALRAAAEADAAKLRAEANAMHAAAVKARDEVGREVWHQGETLSAFTEPLASDDVERIPKACRVGDKAVHMGNPDPAWRHTGG
ncbi:MAG: hypothetical protein ABR591_16485 [Candidatus Velthaea sp.]